MNIVLFYPRLILRAALALAVAAGSVVTAAQSVAAMRPVPCFAVHEVAFTAAGTYANPYVQLSADATLVEPDGHTTRQVPLFWDGGQTWRFRFAPDRPGAWRWTVKSADRGLDGQSGAFECIPSKLRGSLQPRADASHHFQYQNGEHMWFLGDTAWAYGCDSTEEKHDRAAAERYATNRARQGFNAIHLMLLAEIGWGNRNGPPWHDIAAEKINPDYFREIDERIAFANQQGLVTGLAIAWANKGRNEPYSWGRMPGMPARERYARYATARYSAYQVYFLVAGEWDSEARREGQTEAAARQQFIRLGDVVRASDPHHRMIGIHTTMKQAGSTRDFNRDASWMDFGDYQQNYTELHGKILRSRVFAKPVINGEYAYWLRDANGDGIVDKPHSYTLDDIRAATWDIVMAGGYVVAGFGSTYLGGARHVATFLPDDPRNEPWLAQLGHIKMFFSGLDYAQLEPHDELIGSAAARTADRGTRPNTNDVQPGNTRVPATTYWCLANPGKTYVVYVRGTTQPVTLELAAASAHRWQAERFDPRTGARQAVTAPATGASSYKFTPPDAQDWLVVLRAGD